MTDRQVYIEKAIQDNIKTLRTNLNETQAVFGQRFGASRGSVSQWEKGVHTPTSEVLLKMARLAGVSYSDFTEVQNESLYGHKESLTFSQLKQLHAQNDDFDFKTFYKEALAIKGIDFIRRDLAPRAVWSLIDEVVARKGKVLIVGQTHSGKSLLLNCILEKQPNEHRVGFLEENVLSENDIDEPMGNQPLGSLFDEMDGSLIKDALRKKPDMFYVDEIRGGDQYHSVESYIDAYQCGLVATIHSPSAVGGLNRLIHFALTHGDKTFDEMDSELISETIGRFHDMYDLIVHVDRFSGPNGTSFLIDELVEVSKLGSNSIFTQTINDAGIRSLTYNPLSSHSLPYWYESY